MNCETIAIRPTALGSWYHRYPLDMTYRCGGEGLEYTFYYVGHNLATNKVHIQERAVQTSDKNKNTLDLKL